MAALVPGFEPLRVEGDLFLVTEEAIALMDRLETGSAGLPGPYIRELVPVVSLDGASRYTAQAYPVRQPERWQALVELGRADALTTYPLHLATGERHKECCRRTPGHPPPHDAVDPLEAVEQR